MPRRHEIPIKNIYHMLSYAWSDLDIGDENRVGDKDFDDIYNLFARIYINGLNSLIKRGLSRYYIEVEDNLATVRGRINIQQSINEMSLIDRRLVCEYEEFLKDIKMNQIIKRTINILLSYEGLDTEYKNKLYNHRLYFNRVKDIRLSNYIFRNLRFNRNNNHYKLLINISEFVYNGLLADESVNGEIEFLDFIRDDKLSTLYENFVLNFYKENLDERLYKVHSPIINWRLESEDDENLLPRMETDIVILDKVNKKKLIIDTKFYKETLSRSRFNDLERVKSENLYQIYAYINNIDYDGEVAGMLLYPKVQREVGNKFRIDGKDIYVKTIDLNDDWVNIEERLLDIIKTD